LLFEKPPGIVRKGGEMKKRTIGTIPLLLAGGILLSVHAGAQGIRKPVVAGAFYDGDGAALAARIDGYLDAVKDPPPVSGEVRALICPHAGYIYSGPTAAYAYKLVRGKTYEAVVVIGTSHRYGLDGASIYTKGGFETPLGTAAVDEELAARIARASGFSYIAEAHAEEHSVEVQIPFLQRVLPGVRIVPIVLGYPTRQNVYALAEGIAKACAGKKVLIVASTDMSHYLSKADAGAVDAKTIDLVKKLNVNTLIAKCAGGENIMCGGGGVAAALIALKKSGEPKVEILHYTDSSEASGEERQVVGYLAAAVTVGEATPEFSLSKEEKRELLRLARQAVEMYVAEKKVCGAETRNGNLLSERGAFVTLKKKGELRGCIGFIEPVAPLWDTVIQTAVYAACQDPRFTPVTSEELKELEYEISVLTPLKKIEDPKVVQVGRHGLVIAMDRNRGILLPQVPVENNWDREMFLDQACLKAGLPPDAWKKGAEISIFEAIIFH
jgi:AmmeMemoRadiSam system protein B/AmmeMemoRadiSam system protein A